MYERQFREHHIDGSIMATLTDLVLKDGIGVASYGHRVGLLWQISKARQESSFPALSSKRRLAGKQSTNINMLLTFDVADGGNECWSINAKLTGEAGLNRVDQYVNRIEFTITTEDSSAWQIRHIVDHFEISAVPLRFFVFVFWGVMCSVVPTPRVLAI